MQCEPNCRDRWCLNHIRSAELGNMPTNLHKHAGYQTVHGKRQEMGGIGTFQNYGGWGAGRDREPNTGRRVCFTRVEGKIKGVVKRDGCVVYA